MKKIFIFTVLFFLSILAFAGEPGAKVMAAFQRQFPKITNVHWYSQGSASFAYFSEGGITCNLTYNSKGKLLSSTRYYDEHNLPLLIKTEVLKQFSGLSVFGVTELTVGKQTVYEIQLQDDKMLVTIRSNKYGVVVETARYERS